MNTSWHPESDEALKILFAFRYSLDRETFAVSHYAKWIFQNMKNFHSSTLAVMAQEIREKNFKSDCTDRLLFVYDNESLSNEDKWLSVLREIELEGRKRNIIL